MRPQQYLWLCLMVFSVVRVDAQTTSNANQNVALSLSNAIAITFAAGNSTNGSTITIPFSNVVQFSNGNEVDANQPLLKVQSNKTFNVSVSTSAASFTYTGPVTPAPVMPINNILFMEVTSNATGGAVNAAYWNEHYGSISTTPVNIITGGLAGGNQTFNVEFQATPGFNYPGGVYTANIILRPRNNKKNTLGINVKAKHLTGAMNANNKSFLDIGSATWACV